MSKKINYKIFLLIVLILFISVKYNFFINTYGLVKKDYPNRMNSVYGHCSKEGYGFTKFIHDKYKPKYNLTTINGQPQTYANVDGFFYDKKKVTNEKFKILVNYNENISANFKDFKILEKNKNCYFIKKND